MERMTKLVIENRAGQTARRIDWHEKQVIVIFRRDTKRLELHSDIQDFIFAEIPFEIVTQVSMSEIPAAGLELPGLGVLRRAGENESAGPSIPYIKDDTSVMKPISRWTIGVHVGFISLIILLAYFFKPVVEEAKVVLIPQDISKIAPPPPAREVVDMSEQKFAREEITAKVGNKTVTGRKSLADRRGGRKAKLERNIEVGRMGAAGALGALGGTPWGNPKSAGLSLTAKNISNGTGKGIGPGGDGTGVGLGGAGGIDTAVPGKGIVGTAIGNGGRPSGAGGYGTRGKGGGGGGTGATGYGEFSFAGSSGGYSLPAEEEALVQGGLDRDQISAVINRNLGQIVYCYEKGLQQRANMAGRVAVNFIIGGQGGVRRAGIASSSIKDAGVENCIVNKLKNWKFPKPHGQVDVRVTYPFVLKRVSQG